jgi:hypothetical protein
MSQHEDQISFAVAPDAQGDGIPLVIIGIPRDAWDHMKGGKTHHVDLTKAGIPMKFMLFGGKDHKEIWKTLDAAMAVTNTPYLDERGKDYSIEPLADSEPNFAGTVLAQAILIAPVIDELCAAVDAEGEDVGGHRGSLEILRDIGPLSAALDAAIGAFEEDARAKHADDTGDKHRTEVQS